MRLMAAFTLDEIRRYPRIWNLFRDGPVLLFHRTETLESIAKELTAAGYHIAQTTCDASGSGPDILGRLLQSLGIVRTAQPTNRDAFADLLDDLDATPAPGTVVVLRGFDKLHQRDPAFAFDVVDILAQHHRRGLLTGQRLLILLETAELSDATWQCAIGGIIPLWMDESDS